MFDPNGVAGEIFPRFTIIISLRRSEKNLPNSCGGLMNKTVRNLQ